VDDDLDPVEADVEQLVGFEDLQALVHQGGRIDRDLGPIDQVGWPAPPPR